MGAILNSGRSKFAQHQGLEQPLVINRFVFALIDGLDTGADVDLNESMPAPADIVHEEPVNGRGYLSPDKVVYSVILGPAVGDFYFNWIGLVSTDNTLIAVSYTPTQYKYKTVGLNIGNTLTRNFLLQYVNAQAVTGIDIPVEAWQVDFMGRLDAQDEQWRQDNHSFYGESYFFNDGFEIHVVNGSDITARAGYGYVGGLRASLSADTLINAGALPKDIYIDAALVADVSGSDVIVNLVSSSAANPLNDYVDAAGDKHFLTKIATVAANYSVTDHRKNMSMPGALLTALLSRENHTGNIPLANVQGAGNLAGKNLATSAQARAGTPDVIPDAAKVIEAIQYMAGKIVSVWGGLGSVVDVSAYGDGWYLCKPAAINDYILIWVGGVDSRNGALDSGWQYEVLASGRKISANRINQSSLAAEPMAILDVQKIG